MPRICQNKIYLVLIALSYHAVISVLAQVMGILYILLLAFIGYVNKRQNIKFYMYSLESDEIWQNWSAMAAGRVTFSSAFMPNLLVFLFFSYLSSQSYYLNWRLSLTGHGSDEPGSALEPSSMRYFDLRCLCRVRHFELKSWHTRMKPKRYLRRRLLYSANGTASFNPSILENILSGDIHPQPGPNSTSNSSSTSTNANISFPSC